MKTAENVHSWDALGVLRALSDETRQGIIMVFAHNKELRANDIAEKFSLSRPTVSHHLNLMKRMGVLNSRKSGKEIYYSLNKFHVVQLLNSVAKTIGKCC